MVVLFAYYGKILTGKEKKTIDRIHLFNMEWTNIIFFFLKKKRFLAVGAENDAITIFFNRPIISDNKRSATYATGSLLKYRK
jgi:hypothetical protein